MSTKQIGGYTIYQEQLIGSGSSGRVYRGVKDQTKQLLAIKVISKDLIYQSPYMQSALQTEIKILRSVVSEHTVGLYDIRQSPNNYYIIMELCDSDLSQLIKQGQQLPEDDCIKILAQICEGFLVLVKEGIIHRDLKPQNIMRKGSVFKIGDFGFSKQLQLVNSNSKGLLMHSQVGTCQYMSIELLKKMPYSSKCDIWALGLIFYQLLHGEMPWVAHSDYELITKIESIPLTINRKDLSPTTMDFLERCLKLNECDRIFWNQVFVHPIFQGRFLLKCDENKQFQNKMKSIMTKLREYFNRKPENIIKYFTSSTHLSKEKQLNYEQYFQLLSAINPTISHNEAKYIFARTDLDSSGTITLNQIGKVLETYGMNVQNIVSSGKLGLNGKIIQQKLLKFFVKLKKLIYRNKLSLRRVFNDFDKDSKKGKLSFDEFKLMLQKISNEITAQEAFQAFNFIDEDDSRTIQFEEILKHYELFNNLAKEESS